MKKTLTIAICCSFFWCLSGCYPGNADYIDELDIVYTNYDKNFDFASHKTYALPDKIIKISDNNFNGDNEPDFVDPKYADVILNLVKQNMDNYGFNEVSKDDNPDIIMLLSVNTTTNLYYYYDWGYWGWYYPGWFPGWGWYYPGYYYPSYVTSYRSGSLFIQMTDPTQMVDDNISVVWNCIINGLLEGSAANINTRLTNTVNQAFEQSSYLGQ